MDGAGGSVVGPSITRLRVLTLVLSVPAVALAVLPVVLDPDSPWLASSILLLVLVPVLVGVVVHIANNHRLTVRGPDLVYTDWRGREHVVPGADIATASIGMVGGPMNQGAPRKRLVIERHSTGPPLVIDIGLWNQDEIRRLLVGFGVEVEHAGRSVRWLQYYPPGHRPPFTHRHPTLMGLLSVVGFVAAVAVIIGILEGS